VREVADDGTLTGSTEEQKEEERRRKQEAKEVEKLRKEQEKEEKRRAKEEKKKAKESPKVAAAFGGNEEENAVEETAPLAPVPPVTMAAVDGTADQPPVDDAAEARPKSKDEKKPLALMLKKRVAKEDREDAREDESRAVEDGPRSPSKKGVKTWFKSHFSSRPRTKSSTSDHRPTTATEEQLASSSPSAIGPAEGERGFIGGAALREQHSQGQSSVSSDSSLRDVALANVGPDTLREELPSPAVIADAPESASVSGAPMSEPAAESLVQATAVEPLFKASSPIPYEAEPGTLDMPSPITQEPAEPVTLREVSNISPIRNPSVSSVSSLSSSKYSDEDADNDLRFEDASPFTRAEMARPKSPLASLAAKVVEGESQSGARPSTPPARASPTELTESARPSTPPPALAVPDDPTTMARSSASPKRESRFAEIID
jgi:hypothetical protein